MTQPDELFPEDAANFGSFAAFAAKTQADYESELKGAETTRWGLLGPLGDIPIIGPLLETFISFLSGGSQTSGDVSDLAGLLDNIPLLGPLMEAITGLIGGAGGGSGGGNPLDMISQFFQDLLGMLGLGGSGMGSGGGTTPDPDDPDAGTVTPGAFDPDAALGKLLTKLVGAGVLTSDTPIPAHLLTALTPGTSANVLPDAGFDTAVNVKGQGRWIWDWPDQSKSAWGGSGCVRTVRPDTITVYYVPGTWELLPGSPGSAQNATIYSNPKEVFRRYCSDLLLTKAELAASQWPYRIGENLLDMEHFEFIVVPYAAAMYPMGASVDGGVRNLINLINQIPGKFILIGHSQGGGVISNVYDEIRYGTLQHRNADLLMGVGIGNTRRQKGQHYPNSPVYSEADGYGPDGYGCYTPTLANCEDRWWEFSLQAGTYPAFDDPHGVTYDTGDVISCLGDTDQVDKDMRGLIHTTMAAQGIGFDIAGLLLQFLTSAAGQKLQAGTSMTAPHNSGMAVVQPWLAAGDHRTWWQYLYDSINSFAGLVSPPVNGSRHQIVGVPVPVQEFQVLVGGAWVQWINVVCEGPAIMVGVNAYDADGHLISGDVHPTISVIAADATIENPVPSSDDWVYLEASFVMPPGAKTARLVCDVEPQAMTTGTVWFDSPVLQVSNLIDSSLLTNIENIPQLPGTAVQGPQGIADMLTAYQNLIDGMASAAEQGNLTGTQLGAMFESQGQTALNAFTALELSIAQQQAMANNSLHPLYNGLQPTAEATYPLGNISAGASLPSVTVAAGHSVVGFINCAQAATKGFIEFMAQGSGTGIYVNVYKVDSTTGAFSHLWSTGDISGIIPLSWGWVSIVIPGSQQIPVTPGMLIALEIVAQGSSLDVVAESKAIPNHPTAIPPNLGASRITSSTGGISPLFPTMSQFTFSGTEPFITFGVENLPPGYQPAAQRVYKAAGDYVYNIPDWMESGDIIDVAICSGGGGGDPGAIFGGPFPGGAPGVWKLASLTYGTDIPLTTTTLNVHVGAGGAIVSGAGTDGGNSTISGTGVTTLTAAGGKAKQTVDGSGPGPGNATWQGRTYFGGSTVAAGQNGSKPGGAGGGGSPGIFGLFGVVPPGAGADGAAFLTARQK